MKLLYIVFFLFTTFVTDSVAFENKHLTSLVDKTTTISPSLTKHPKKLLRRKVSIPESEKDKAVISFWNRNQKEVNSSKLISKNGERYRRQKQRNQKRNRRKYSDETAKSSSTSMEMKQWKQEFDEDWLKLKEQAIIQIHNGTYWHGDEVGMNAARPWAAPCGDPSQHDWPWGTCMLHQQCDPEYRIYRGDHFCGRTSFICCAVQLTQHDLYQGLDLSLVRTSSSSSDEKSKRDVDPRQRKREKKHKLKIKAYRKHKRQKRVIKRKIKDLVHKLKRDLNRAYRNLTRDRKIRLDLLTKKIKKLKAAFREQRKMAKFRHELDIDEMKRILYNKLINLNAINTHFLINVTFREFLRKHNITVHDLQSLQLEYPNLAKYVAGDGTISPGLQEILDLAKLNETLVGITKTSTKSTIHIHQVITSIKKTTPVSPPPSSPKQPTFVSLSPINIKSTFSQPPKRKLPPQLTTLATPEDDNRNGFKKKHQLRISFEETDPTELPINFLSQLNKKKNLRTFDISPHDVSASFLYTPLSANKSQIMDISPLNKRVPEAVYSEEETYVTDNLESSQVKGQTFLNKLSPTMQAYDAMQSEEMADTRRSGRGIFFERKEKPKKFKRGDYLEYDIEYGLLYT